MKKRGFTLVEMLAVIAVLGVMMVLVVPKIGGSVESKKEKEYEKIIEIVESAAKTYHSFNKNDFNISVNTLIEEKYLSSTLVNPVNGEKIDGCVNITNSNEGYKYTYTSCDSVEVPLTVELNGGDSNQVFEEKYLNGTKIKLTTPEKLDNDFDGWEVVEGNSILESNTLIIGNTPTTLYAMWTGWPYFNADINGGQTTQTFEEKYKSRSLLTLIDPTKTGNTFTGWSVTEGNGLISGNIFTMGTIDTKIKATWAANKYLLSYNLNGGSHGTYAPTSGTYDKVFRLSNPTKAGHTFTGWTVTSGLNTSTAKYGTSETDVTNSISGSNILVTAEYFKNLNITNNATVAMRANFNAYTYTISYSLNGGSHGTYHPTSGTYDTAFRLSNPTKAGYTFTGWTVTSGLNTSTAKYGTSTSNATSSISSTSTKVTAEYFKNLTQTNGGSVTLTANWTPKVYTISYSLGGGSHGTYAPTSGTYDTAFRLSNPTRAGYNFAGWTVTSGLNTGSAKYGTSTSSLPNSISSTSTKVTAEYFINVTQGSSITLTANWNPKSYYITINNGTNILTTVNGLVVTISGRSFYKRNAGTTFVGYVYYNGFTGPLLVGTTTNHPAYYTSFDTSITHTYSGSFTYEGKTYYYSSGDYWMAGNVDDSSGLGRKKYTNMTIAAAAQDLIKTSRLYKPCGSTVTISNPTRSGYTFNGWTVSGTGASMSGTTLTVGAGDVNLTANWTKN